MLTMGLLLKLLFLFYLSILSALAVANNAISLSVGEWSFDDLNAKNLAVDMMLTTNGIAVTASADRIDLAPPIGVLSQVNLQCMELIILADKTSCARGNIVFQQQELGLQNLNFEIEALPDKDKYKVEIDNLNLASALFSVTFIVKKDKWKVFADTSQLQLVALIDFLQIYLQPEQLDVLANWTIAGEVKLDIDLFGQADQLTAIELDLSSKTLDLSDNDGLYVSEGLVSILSLEAKKDQQQWGWQIDFSAAAGQAYAEPIFIDMTETPIKLMAHGQWQQGKEEMILSVDTAKFSQGNITEIELSGQGSLSQITELSIDVKQSDLATLYTSWIQPFVVGTALDNVELAGHVNLHYQQNKDDYQLAIGLDKVFVDDQLQRFGMADLSGTLAWSNYDKKQDVNLQWQSAYIYAIPLGASTINAYTNKSSVVLKEPWALPILDGELQLNAFSLHNPGDENLKWTFAGELSPISMEVLSAALDWPLMHGKLSGVIPSVAYSEQEIHIDGALKVKLFEGITTIRDLRLEQPFGSLPQLQANINMKGLNLEILTQTFDFGKITGKLDGKVTNFRLSNWQPVNFDASFATPEGDKSRRKISQKAVDNLSQIGGGATGILQRSFLRFFEDFSYQRLGLSCKLRNDVCEMSGVAEAKEGYYIVKGGGLPPRINVVGYTRQVDWPDLIERLKAVSQSSGPIVQ